MKGICAVLIPVCFPVLLSFAAGVSSPSGFSLPDSVNEMVLQYRTVKGLIVLPVTINDSVHVNLILDTGCRNLVLFGKKFKRMFKMYKGRPVVFSGLGSGQALTGRLSIGNKVSIREVLGEQIPVVVVGSNSLFGRYHNIHGVIGYDIFVKFEIELDARAKTVKFRPASESSAPFGFSSVPLRIVDARPIMESRLIIGGKRAQDFDLMIDTGSSLGLLLKTTDISMFDGQRSEKVLGIGLNGRVLGFTTTSKKLVLHGIEMEWLPTGIVSSPWHNNASIGMDVLKDYILILNYCKAYVCFKRNDV